ncbi:MAG: hypothetical protein HZB56_20940 [Deltaproteobacteria bacterium]|nr:hypothetical protein [Deltaproteobacteria bacterium]
MRGPRATRRPPRRYLVRNAEGRELLCPSLADLHSLYDQGFLTDEDQVKPEGAGEWTPLGRFPALAGAQARRREPRKMALLLAAVAALSLGVWLLARR